ncbi:MAG: hypothetical protein Q9227_004902 [Pyrenula ochraceoflavens]
MHAPFGLVPISLWAQPQESLSAELENWIYESVKFFNPFRTHGSDQFWYPYSVVVWTIPIELKGSMLVYAFTATYVVGGLPGSLNVALLSVSVLALLHFAEWTMACFLAGLILAYLDINSMGSIVIFTRFKHQAQSIARNTAFFIGFYLLSQPAHDGHPEYSLDTPGWHYLTNLTPKSYDKDQYYRYWHAWGAWLMVYSCLRISWLQGLLNTRPLRYLGKVSFMLYLVHLPLISIVGTRLQRFLGQVPPDAEARWYDNKMYIPDFGPKAMSSRFLVSMAVWLPICLCVADLGTSWLDQPSVSAGKKLAKKLSLDSGGTNRPTLAETARSAVL